MIKCCRVNQEYSKAYELFEEMKQFSISKPNIVTYNCIIDVCVKSNNLEKAKKIFEEMSTSEIKPDLISYSTIMKIYTKSKDLNGAYQVLDDMIKKEIMPDDIIINLMLDATADYKNYKIGLDVYNMMVN